MLQVEDLHVSYGGIAALRGVTLEVGAGEIVILLGPNGAGKTTTLSSIVGLTSPTQGTVRFGGEPLHRQVPERIVRRGITLVPEGRHIFGTLTVAENLRLGATTRRDGEVAADLERILARFPVLERYAGTIAGKLSGGEQQQLAIARALMLRPKLLLLDEPSLGLSPLLVKEIFAIVKRVNVVLRGFLSYFFKSVRTPLEALDGWVRGRLRSILRRRSGRRGRSQVSDSTEWPNAFFDRLGLFSLARTPVQLALPRVG